MAKYQGTLSVQDNHSTADTLVLFETQGDPKGALHRIAQHYYAAIGLQEAGGEVYFPEVGMTVKPCGFSPVSDGQYQELQSTLTVIPVPFDIEGGLANVCAAFGSDRFEDGECHILAMALLRTIGKGKLWACMRETLDDDGSVYATGYSHMVYECAKSELWDINGIEADVHWEERFQDLDIPDKWGMTARFKWVEVPHTLPDLVDVQQWLSDHGAVMDQALLYQVQRCLSGQL